MFLHQLYCSGETSTPDTVESGNPPEADPIERLSVQALKRELDSAGVPHGDCVEKSELVARLRGCAHVREDAALARELEAQSREEEHSARAAQTAEDEQIARQLQEEFNQEANADEDAEQGRSAEWARQQADMDEALAHQMAAAHGDSYSRDQPRSNVTREIRRPARRPFSAAQHIRGQINRMRDTERDARFSELDQSLNRQGAQDFLDLFLGARARAAPRPSAHEQVQHNGMQDLMSLLAPFFSGRAVRIGEDMSYEDLLRLQEHLGGNVNSGADEATINQNTRTETFIPHPDAAEASREQSSSIACAVCLCDFETGEQLRELKCTHKFHSSCVDQWLKINKTCPICKAEIA